MEGVSNCLKKNSWKISFLNIHLKEQFDNIFVSIIASHHKYSQSIIIFCIKIND